MITPLWCGKIFTPPPPNFIWSNLWLMWIFTNTINRRNKLFLVFLLFTVYLNVPICNRTLGCNLDFRKCLYILWKFSVKLLFYILFNKLQIKMFKQKTVIWSRFRFKCLKLYEKYPPVAKLHILILLNALKTKQTANFSEPFFYPHPLIKKIKKSKRFQCFILFPEIVNIHLFRLDYLKDQ